MKWNIFMLNYFGTGNFYVYTALNFEQFASVHNEKY